MHATSTNAILIDKDQVKNLKFPLQEILISAEDLTKRKNDLSRALTLGNVHHNKVRIVFHDYYGPKVVETTIWAVTELRVILKSGMVIPINRIQEIII